MTQLSAFIVNDLPTVARIRYDKAELFAGDNYISTYYKKCPNIVYHIVYDMTKLYEIVS